jgi:NitT/TauT family transport system substrate-binding protein
MSRFAARPRTWAATCLVLVAVLLSVGVGPAPPGGGEQALAAAATGAAAPDDTVAPAPAGQPSPTRVRYATQFASAGAALYVAQDRGYFQQEGIDLDFVPFTNNSEMVPSLATDQVEAGGISLNVATMNALNRGVRLKAVLDQGSLRPGYGFTALVIRKDLYDAGRGRTLGDLRGLNLVNTPPGKATTNYCAMSYALQRQGVPQSDVEISPLPFPDMVPALANGAIDGGLMGEPFMMRALQQGSGVKVMGQDEMYPNFSVNFVAYSQGLYANRPAARGFARAYVRAIRDYNAAVGGRTTPADRAQVDESIARYTRIDVNTVHEMAPVGFNPNGLLNQESMLWCYPFYREMGFLTDTIPDSSFAALWGTELMDEVLAEIGRVAEN